jgi:hypothetical protein
MKKNAKITCLQELLDWINNSNTCHITEHDTDYFIVEAPNNADIYVRFEKYDDIEKIVKKTIEKLYNFDADERFMELWSVKFANQNHFLPSHFIKMLQEDEASLKELAGELRELSKLR